MKVVKISHNEYGNGCKYLFATRKSLKNGDIVLVETKNGNAVGWCVGDSKEIKKEDLEFLENACPYELPLKKVIGVMEFWGDER